MKFKTSAQLAYSIFLSWLKKCFGVTKYVQKSGLKEAGPDYGQKNVCLVNHGQNICYKVEKSSEIGQDFKTLQATGVPSL